jgi:hypothetical protein
MSSICVLRTPNVKPRLQKQNHGRSDSHPISLLAFLQAENRRLRSIVDQLEQDTMALRDALESN